MEGICLLEPMTAYSITGGKRGKKNAYSKVNTLSLSNVATIQAERLVPECFCSKA